MRILVLGAQGFIGRHACEALEKGGYVVQRMGRRDFDFTRDHDERVWERRLEGVDVAVNAVGIFREEGAQTFEAVHVLGPIALFKACAALGVKVIQVSALGADPGAESAFHRSKRRADEALLALPVRSVVLQPSLVFGADGESAKLFAMLASLPVIPLPRGGMQQVQPIHVDDVAAAIVAIVRNQRFLQERIALVGPEAIALRDYLAALRAALGLGRARFVPIPAPVVTASARLRVGWLDPESWRMLERGNVGDPSVVHELLGRAPRAPMKFVAANERDDLLSRARLGWLLPVVRISIAIMWIAAGVVSAGIYPVEDSLAMLARVHVTGTLASVMLYGAAAFDFAMGIATLFVRRRWLWLLQMVAILAYTAIITVFLPEQWLHPFGPVVKNLPVLAAIWLMYEMERH
jgi:uncharacterized protein YbjT (DUF2867 family)